ncbi:phytolongin Phyl2.2-like [Camellia sinensis]|uniref:phytolongin Phyl2.2-like n=1 Tax=Camellia sinensis TaxID=4442 RepID=UPI0010363F5A|nr:phytolongin Phyl2.2-like [Camellia sinensis]XP_028118615.1 phytolongin Phyl2.2-like [Camellia sinensis]
MISNPNLILYNYISKGATILAEFNSQDASLATLASKCLDNASPLHTTFSHTIWKRTHTLIHHPFLYFTIYDQNLHNSKALCFLTNAKQSFDKIISGETAKSLENLNSHRFQGEFNPILAPQLDSGSLDRLKSLKKKKKKKKKKRSSVETIGQGKDKDKDKDKDRDGLVENKVDVSEDVIVMSRELSYMSMQKNGLFVDAKAKRIWKRQAWVVLSLVGLQGI